MATLPLRLETSDTPATVAADAPLAERLRPAKLAEVIGQRQLLGPGKPLRVAFESGRLHSMILWGPPGVGKTTLARLVAGAFDAQFIAISAVLGGVKDIREAVERAQALHAQGRRTVVFGSGNLYSRSAIVSESALTRQLLPLQQIHGLPSGPMTMP